MDTYGWIMDMYIIFVNKTEYRLSEDAKALQINLGAIDRKMLKYTSEQKQMKT